VTARLQCPSYHHWMTHKNVKRESGKALRDSVKKEMAKPRMARSAKLTELSLDTSRIPEEPSVTLPGTVDKIIPSPRSRQPEKAHIAVDGADRLYRYLRIENILTDENGDDVKLKKGAHVEVTVEVKGVKPVD
jgi:hypothetical protein